MSLVPAGAPKSWKELESTATSLISSGKANVGIVTHLDGYFMQPFFDSLGGYVFANKNGSYTNTKQVGLNSKALAKNASLMDTWLDKKIFDKANTYDGSNFSNGKAPYAIVGPWSIDGLNKAILDNKDVAIFDDGLQDRSINYDLKIVCFNDLKLIGFSPSFEPKSVDKK